MLASGGGSPKIFRDIPKKCFRTYQKLASKIRKFCRTYKKCPLTSRNSRKHTKIFSLHHIFSEIFILPECRIDFCPTAEIWGARATPPPPPGPYAYALKVRLVIDHKKVTYNIRCTKRLITLLHCHDHIEGWATGLDSNKQYSLYKGSSVNWDAESCSFPKLHPRVGWLQNFYSSLQLQLLQKYVVSYNYTVTFR
jgi:hypothetical protein